MQHNTFGRRTGLRVSELALGTSNFGTGWATGADHATSSAIFTAFADAGGTFIDTADTYQHGESETYLADFLAADRDHFTVASKYGFGSGTHTGVTATGNSRKALRRSLEATLTRLGTDYLDLYWVHAPDFLTPAEEIVEALDDLVRAGKILYAGLSNFSAWATASAVARAEALGRSSVIGVQFEYSLAARDAERDLIPMAEHLGLGAALYSPLGGGLLTGKYRHGTEGRLSTLKSIIQREDTDQKTAVVDALLEVSSATGDQPAEVAIAYLLERSRRSDTALIPVIGPRSTAQLTSYLHALAVRLDEQHYQRLDAVSAPTLGIPHDGAQATRPALVGGDTGNVTPAGAHTSNASSASTVGA
ncbi:aldo/keto reductase [Mycobacterium hodleri]|uniref:aldo/keto reductase n=1 Tax=Mycolicibacterium hodleri TaxID=49897 RepID=UPI0021F30E6D|nr:aldo/keto reductase [Mycolicibacterium hodleri]MCV7133441.1 aldo/keto reductase [Mycolicibacterium hodleri]